MPAALEHVNVTVPDPAKTARMLSDLFGWNIRWQGDAIHGGRTIHIGSDFSYLAIYSPPENTKAPIDTHHTIAGLNHIGVVVDDLDAVEQKVIARGLTPTSHADYEPGRRFYFEDPDGVEYEVISYD